MWYNIILAAGIVVLFVAILFFRETRLFLKQSRRATATVIDIETISHSDGDTYRPVFSFNTDAGQQIIYRPDSSSSPAGWQVNEKVTIAYNAHDPQTAKPLTFFSLYGRVVMLVILALVLLFIGAGCYLFQ